MSFFAAITRYLLSSSSASQKSLSITRRMAATINMPRDPNTLSNYNSWKTKHIQTEFTIDFDSQKLIGNVTLNLESIAGAESDEIVLDTSYLDIKDISLDG